MKKHVLYAAFLTLSASLFAERAYISGHGLETLELGECNVVDVDDLGSGNSNPHWWASFGTNRIYRVEDMALIKEHAGDGYKLDNDYYPNGIYDKFEEDYFFPTNGTSGRYIEFDSGLTHIQRIIDKTGQGTPDGSAEKEVGNDGIYIDTMVQFTAMDVPPAPSPGYYSPNDTVSLSKSGDKLLIWLYEHEDGSGAIVTNLMITCGEHEKDGDRYVTVTNTVGNFEVSENAWYRLTVVAEMFTYYTYNTQSEDVTTQHGRSTIRFKVYIDGTQLVAENGKTTFLSMVQYDVPFYDSIYQIGFAGQGAVDDIVFGSGTPYPPDSIEFAVTADDGIESFTYTIDGGEPITATGSFDITDADFLNKEIAITGITYKEGYLPDPNCSPSEEKPKKCLIRDGESISLVSKMLAFNVTIGDEEYKCYSLAQVTNIITGATSPATIQLCADYSLAEGERIEVDGGELAIDLCGHALKSGHEATSILYVYSGKVTLIDSLGGGVLKYEDGVSTPYLIQSAGMLIIGQETTDTLRLENGRIYLRGATKDTFSILGGQFEMLPLLRRSKVEVTDFSEFCPSGMTLRKATADAAYYTLQEIEEVEPTEEVAADEMPTTEYSTAEEAEAAAAKIAVIAPAAAGLNASEAGTYSEYVGAAAVQSGDKYTVAAVIKDDKVEELKKVVDAGAEQALSLTESGSVEIDPVVPGLYYTFEQGDSLPLENGTTTLAESGDEKLEFDVVVEKDAKQGFYRVKVSATDPTKE